jgi:membrane-associated phospholipid phosphatase
MWDLRPPRWNRNMPLSIASEIAALDDRALLWLNQFMFRWPFLDRSVAWLLDAHIVKFGPIVLAVCWLWFERNPKQAFNRHLLVESVLTGFAALVVARALALALPFRYRPAVRPDLHFVVPFDAGLRTWSSFPSDHAVMAFALAASLFRLSPRLGVLACLHAAVIICLPRLYFGLHHPSDLISGGLIGVTFVLATSRLQGRHAITASLMEAERKHPAMFYAIGFLVLYEITEMFDSFRALAQPAFRVLRQVLA